MIGLPSIVGWTPFGASDYTEARQAKLQLDTQMHSMKLAAEDVSQQIRRACQAKLQQDTHLKHNAQQFAATSEGIALPPSHPDYHRKWLQGLPNGGWVQGYSSGQPVVYSTSQSDVREEIMGLRKEVASLREELQDLAAQLGIEPKL